MPRGYNVGAGIASGAQAFVQSFMQARQMKEQEKLQQNAFLVQVLTKQLEDETVPYFQRAKKATIYLNGKPKVPKTI